MNKRMPKDEQRDREVWRLKVWEGKTIAEIHETTGLSTRTVDRILARMRKRYCVKNEGKLKRTLGESLAEKRLAQNKMREIMERPPRRGKDGRVMNDIHVRIEAARLYIQISNDLDRLFGLDNVELRRKVDEIKQKLKSEERYR